MPPATSNSHNSSAQPPSAPPATARRRRWPTWLMAAGLLALFLAVTIQKITSVDIWWQLRTGEWIWENKAWPRLDELSYTANTHPWIELRWLFCLWAYFTWQVGGPTLLIIAKTISVAAALGLAIWPSRRVALTPAAGGLIALAITAGMTRWVTRPELVTYVLVALYLVTLERIARARTGPAALILLPIVQVLWTNSHTMFAMGPVLAWMWVVADAAQRILHRLRDGLVLAPSPSTGDRAPFLNPRLIIVALSVTLACLINPWFIDGALFPILLFREMQGGNVLAANIAEFLSPFAVPDLAIRFDLWAALGLAILGGATFFTTRARPDLARLAVLAASTYLAALSQRNVGLFAVMALWAGLRNVAEAAEKHASPATTLTAPCALRGLLSRGASLLTGIASLSLGWFIATDRYAVITGAPRQTGLGVVWWNTAQDAADFALRVGIKPQIYNWMQDGGCISWRAKAALPVFVDGRLEVYGESFLAEFFAMRGDGWDALVNRWGINAAIVPSVSGAGWLTAAMRRSSPGWVPVHIDPHAILFVRDIPEHARIIREYAIDPSRPFVPREPEPVETLSSWRAALGCAPRPWYSEGMARGFLLLGSAVNSSAYLERALAATPDNRALRLAFAQTLFALRRLDAARLNYRRALGPPAGPAARPGPGSADDWMNLGLCCEAVGDAAGAMDAYRECARLDPARAQVHNQMGILCAKQGDAVGAEKHFADAVAARPGYEEAARNLEFIRAQQQK